MESGRPKNIKQRIEQEVNGTSKSTCSCIVQKKNMISKKARVGFVKSASLFKESSTMPVVEDEEEEVITKTHPQWEPQAPL